MSWVRGAMLESYTEVARSVGLDPERMLRNAGITDHAVHAFTGFLDGRWGFMLAVSNAEGTYYRYVKLWLAQRGEAAQAPRA